MRWSTLSELDTRQDFLNATIRLVLPAAAILLLLPPAGAVLAGHPWRQYFEFPPLTRYVAHAGFSWTAFAVFTILNLLMLLGLGWLIRGVALGNRSSGRSLRQQFPRWGWIGLVILISGWILAWQRFPWFAIFQGHTFCLPWIGYIILVNALCVRRSGTSPATDATGRFLLLWPMSALFWWFFEYLNRFVQNWYYIGIQDFGPWAYTFFASLAFATVLPAVLSTYRLLLTFHPLGDGLRQRAKISRLQQRFTPKTVLILSALGLFLIGLFPDYLFALVWVAPLLVITSLQAMAGRVAIFHFAERGDWRPIVTPAIAALVCGFFWEMWNSGSLARWEYAIPFVDRFHIFAMPILGYGGYLPFGLECIVICQWLMPDNLIFPWQAQTVEP